MALREASLLNNFDELCRGFNLWMNGDPLKEFQNFAQNQEECRKKWVSTEELCCSVLKELNDARAKKEKLELQVKHITEMLKNEIQIRQRVQREERELERKLRMVKSIVSNDNNIAEDTRDKLVSLTSSSASGSRWDSESPANYLIDTTSDEIESSTRSILSSLDVTVEKTDEDMELSYVRSIRDHRLMISGEWKRPSADFIVRGRRKLSQESLEPSKVQLGPQPTVDLIKPDLPQSSNSLAVDAAKQRQTSSSCNSNQFAVCSQDINETTEVFKKHSNEVHRHKFATKVILKQEVCISCKNRIRFGKSAMKCVHCLLPCHVECCSESLTMPPCIPTVRAVHHYSNLVDYSPKHSPMIPALLVLCVEEIESRGLEEIGIYRAQAEDKEVHALKEKILSGKLKRNQLTCFDIHIVAGVVRSFLLSLKNPIVTYALRESFIKISYIQHEADAQTAVCELVPQLPLPNRDTLAYLIIHLQKIAESQKTQMSKKKLAKYFAPLFIGNPHTPIEDGLKKLQDLKEQQMAMEKLLHIPNDYWSCFVKQPGVILETHTPTAYANRNKKKSGFFTSPHY